MKIEMYKSGEGRIIDSGDITDIGRVPWDPYTGLDFNTNKLLIISIYLRSKSKNFTL